MRKTLLAFMMLSAFAATAQTMKVNVGNVTYAIPASQAGDMFFEGSTGLTIGNKTYSLSEVTSICVDDSAIDDNTVTVNYEGASAHVMIAGNIAHQIEAKVSGAHVALLQAADVSDEITYTLSGSSDNGSLYMDGSLKASFVLNGLSLTNPDSAAINIRDGKRINVQLSDGTVNTLVDGSNGSQKACFMVKGHTEFKGGGSLRISGNTKHGFWGKEYVELKKTVGTITIDKAVGDGMNINQYLEMKGGSIVVSNVGDEGIQVSKTDDDTDERNGHVILTNGTLDITVTAAAAKGLKCDSLMTITDGTYKITTSGGVMYDSDDKDYKGSSCLKSDYSIVINGGTLTLTSTGQGGKAISSDGTLVVNGGNITAKASGSNYGSSSSGGGFGPGGGGSGRWGSGGSSSSSNHKYAKCIKSDGNMVISGGYIDAYSASHEGIESKGTLTISGGTVYVKASDDAINSAGDMTISGGSVYAYSTSNDGLDSNGNMNIQGGVVMAFGAGGAETGIDIDEKHSMSITGGSVFGIGGRIDGSFSGCTQSYGYTSQSVSCSSGGYFVLSDSSSKRLFAVKVPASYSGVVLVSSPSMSKDSSYSIGSSTSVSGTEENGFIASPTASQVSNTRNITAR